MCFGLLYEPGERLSVFWQCVVGSGYSFYIMHVSVGILLLQEVEGISASLSECGAVESVVVGARAEVDSHMA